MDRGSWYVGVLGPLTVECDGGQIDISAGRLRTLLAVLLAAEAPVSRDRLIDECWGERPPATATSMVHIYISKLRGLVGDLLTYGPAGYALGGGDLQLDVTRFDSLIEQARAAEPERARALLRGALDLCRGEPLCDVDGEGSVREWRRALAERHLDALMLWADSELAAGQSAELVPELRRLTDHHPYEERLWAQLMLALYRAGRHAEALETYQRARTRLADELGLIPGPRIRELQEQILNHDPILDLPSGSSANAAQAVAATQPPRRRVFLPQPMTRLIGRDATLLALAGIVDDPFCRLVTLTGLGGVGKTRLAITHAARWSETLRDGVVFVGLAELTDASQVRAEIAAAVARSGDSSEPNELTLTRFLRDRELLLVLDNFEHLPEAAGTVAELLREAPGLKVLITSRVPLRIRGERRFEVEPLPTFSADGPGVGPAVQLFLQGAVAVDASFAPDPAQLAVIAEICTALDGLPLAIELAAARTSVLSPAAIAAQLEAPLTIGRGELRDLPERHQTVEAALRWSYDLLTEPLRHALRAAAVFAGAFSVNGLSAVAGDEGVDELDELVAASLVQRGGETGRFRLLDLPRSFALARVAETGEGEALRARHRRYLAGCYADVASQLNPANPGQLAAEMAVDHADIRAGIASAVAAGDRESAVTLARSLQPIWMVGALEESGVIVDSILEACAVDPDEELNLLRMAAYANGHRETGPQWQRRRADRARELNRPTPQAASLANLLGPALNRLDRDAIATISAEVLALLMSNADITPLARAEALGNLAEAAFILGDTETALERSAESLSIAEAQGRPHTLAKAQEMHLSLSSAQLGWISPAPLSELVESALGLRLPDITVITLWACARYALGFDAELGRRWAAAAERQQIELGAQSWRISWRIESLAVLGVDESTALLAGVPVRPIHDVLTEARDWLAGRDPQERAPRPAPPPDPTRDAVARTGPDVVV